MQSTITRRAALTGSAAGAAAIVAGTGTAIADDHPDAELRRLWAEYQHHFERYEAARVACAPARAAFDAEYPPCPPDVLPGHHWEAQQPLWHKHGLEELWGEVERRSDKLWELVGAIQATPADGLFGIGVKLAAGLPDHQDEDTVEGAVAALADIKRLTGADFQAGLSPADDPADSGEAYVTAYEALRMRVSTGGDVETGQSTGICIWEPDPPHSDTELERLFALNKSVWADPAGNRKMADYCIASGRTFPAAQIVRVQS